MQPRPPMPSLPSPPISPSCAAARIRKSWSNAPSSWASPASALPTAIRLPASCARIPPPCEEDADGNKRIKLKIAPGARLIFADGTPDILAYPQDRSAWGRLTRLLTVGKSRGEKAECILYVDDLLEHIEGLNLIVLPADAIDAAAMTDLLVRLNTAAPAIRLAGGQHALSWRRPPPADAADRDCRRCLRAADCRERRALSCAGTAGAAGHRDLHPRACDHRDRRPPAGSQCRAPPEAAAGDGAAVPRGIRRRSRRRSSSSNAAHSRSKNYARPNTRPRRATVSPPRRMR